MKSYWERNLLKNTNVLEIKKITLKSSKDKTNHIPALKISVQALQQHLNERGGGALHVELRR